MHKNYVLKFKFTINWARWNVLVKDRDHCLFVCQPFCYTSGQYWEHSLGVETIESKLLSSGVARKGLQNRNRILNQSHIATTPPPRDILPPSLKINKILLFSINTI